MHLSIGSKGLAIFSFCRKNLKDLILQQNGPFSALHTTDHLHFQRRFFRINEIAHHQIVHWSTFSKIYNSPNLLQLYSMKHNTSFGIDYCISAAISSWIKPLKVALQMELCLFNSRLCRNLKCIPKVSEHWSVSVLPTLIEWNLDILKFESILNASNVCINCIKLVILLTLFTILKLH